MYHVSLVLMLKETQGIKLVWPYIRDGEFVITSILYMVITLT